MARLWKCFWCPANRFSWAMVFVAGGLLTTIVLGGLNAAWDQTKSLEFCISCHEMKQTVYQEYKKSAHYMNASGVRVVCADCHVPAEFGPRMIRQAAAAVEVLHSVLGTIDTPEKFEARRLQLATRVWNRMKATNSRSCRKCHSYGAMDFHKQSRRAGAKMKEAMEDGKTCIDCHKGLTHKLPVGYDPDD